MKKVVAGVGNLFMSSTFFVSNAFEKFKLPVTLNVNLENLEQSYFKAQQEHHPDRHRSFINIEESSLKAAAFNEAYQILKDPLKRATHLLKCLGWIDSVENSETQKDSTLLVLMMELNERIEKATSDEEKQKLASFLKEEIQKNWTALENSVEKKDKENSLSLLNRLTYLKRLQQNLIK